MHPNISKHYDEELASLVVGGRTVLNQKFSQFFACFFQREQPCASHPANHLLITVRTF